MVEQRLFTEAVNPLVDLQQRLAKIEASQSTHLEAVTTLHQQTQRQLASLMLWAQALLVGLVVVAMLVVGSAGVLWWQMRHLATVQIMDAPPPQAPVPRPQPPKK